MSKTTIKKSRIAKAGDGGDVHIGQTLYDQTGDPRTVKAITGGMVTLSGGPDGDIEMPLALIRSGEKAGLIGTSNPHLIEALKSVGQNPDESGFDDTDMGGL